MLKRFFLFFIFLFFSTTLYAFHLTGTWKLIAIERKGNTRWMSDCTSPTGLLIYTVTGYMSASVNCMQPNNPKQPSFLEKDMTFYSGTYSVHGNTVIHHANNANSAAYFNKDLTRKIEILSDKKINLLVQDNKGKLIRLEWERTKN